MEQIAKDIWFVFRVICLFGGSAAAITFCVAIVCRWMEWAPVNTVVHIHYHERSGADVGGSKL
jgi:hypothetical protein